MNQRFGVSYHLHLQGLKSVETEINMYQVTRHNSTDTLAARRYIREDGNILLILVKDGMNEHRKY
jgi:hypothetical protein